jgi:uroporphyrinogen III methyltransferase/synthase
MPAGKVYLVGAGPGDPGLLTLRARDLLAMADAVLYDALVNPALLQFAQRAEKVYGGKQAGRHSLPQADINALLLDLASRHQHVVRLKGGDPFVFGRGGEECLFLQEHGIAFEVVPGVTSGIAVPAYAGIPVTHRGIARGVTLVTGHVDASGCLTLGPEDVPQRGTIVVYMGLRSLPQVVALLLQCGRSEDTPAALIAHGTHPTQQRLVATLGSIAAEAEEHQLPAPALLVVGEAVSLHAALSWWERRPLAGVRILVTHAPRQHDELAERLRLLGASVLQLPMVDFAMHPVATELPDIAPGDALLLTSANAVAFVFEMLAASGRDLRRLAGVRIVAVGRSAAQALEARYVRADAHVDSHEPAEAVAALRADASDKAPMRVWIPASTYARRALPEALSVAGFSPMPLPAYTQRPPGTSGIAETLREFRPQLVVFTNSAAVRAFVEREVAAEAGDFCTASIGAVTSTALRESGLSVGIEAIEPTVESLVDTIAARWKDIAGT